MRALTDTRTDNRTLGRVVAAALVGLLTLCFLTSTEWWPLSSFALFSQVRGAEQTSWALYVVQANGERVPVDLDALPEAYWGAHHVLPTLTTLADEEQRTVVSAYLEAAGYDPAEAQSVEVVRTVSDVPTDLETSMTSGSETIELEIALP